MIKLEPFTADTRMEIYHLAYDASLEYECLISPAIFTVQEIEEGPLSIHLSILLFQRGHAAR